VKPFVDEYRQRLGVEPICRAMQIAPSAYWREAARERQPALCPARRQRDTALVPEVRRVFLANMSVYGADKVWRQLKRERIVAARCTVERLMRRLGLRGVMRGKGVRTTRPDPKAACPLDRVNREFHAQRPNQLWVSDFTYVWEQALYARRPGCQGELIHHSDRGSQYVCIRYSERLAEAGIEPSVGSIGDSYDNALAETINGLYKAELIHRRAPWKTREAVELATLEWVSWFNHHRLLESIGYIPPAEAEENYWRQQQVTAAAQICLVLPASVQAA
jgi:putative transposase